MIARCSGRVMTMVYGQMDNICLTGGKKCDSCPEKYTAYPGEDVIPYEEMYKLFVTDPVERMAIEIHE